MAILLAAGAATECMAQRSAVAAFAATRHEITAALDARPCRAAADLLAPYSPAVDSVMAPVLGRCEGGMGVWRPESPLADWCADALREACREHFGQRADAAVYNIGGIRSTMPAGTVTQGHIFEIAPFENYLCLLTMSGETLTALCRNIAASHGEGISGLRITATRGGELVEATIGGEAIDPQRTYTVATLNYLAEGNDGMTALKQAAKRQDTRIAVREILMEAVRRQQVVAQQVDGRMTIVEDGAAPHQAPPATGRIRILHTNDTHSQIMPYNPHSTDRDRADKGGFVRRATFIEGARRGGEPMMLVDAGDFSQGSIYYNLYKGEVEVRMMNQMGYDACTIGNHEFDFGLDNMARLFRMAAFTVVCCNYDFTGTVLEGLVKPYTVIERGGLRIGITGVGCRLEGMVAAHNCEGVAYADPVEALAPVVERLRNEEGCQLVVCLSHLGAQEDKRLIAGTRGMDIVIGGHSHTLMELPTWTVDPDGTPVPNYQMGKAGLYVGDVLFEVKR